MCRVSYVRNVQEQQSGDISLSGEVHLRTDGEQDLETVRDSAKARYTKVQGTRKGCQGVQAAVLQGL